MFLKLKVVHSANPQAVSVHDCQKSPWTVGRSSQSDLPLPDPDKWVSSRHAQFQQEGGTWYVVDVGSTNGTTINGAALPPKTPRSLVEGDRIGIGGYTLVVELGFEQTLMGDDLGARPSEQVTRPEPLEHKLQERPAEPAPDRKPRPEPTRQPAPPPTPVPKPAPAPEPMPLTPELQRALEPVALGALGTLARSLLGNVQFESADDVERFCALLREVVACSLDWLVRSLASRKEFENQFSAEMTMMLKLKANPLKAAPDTSQMARRLLGFGEGVEPQATRSHLESAYRDLSKHQLGLFSGVEEAVRTILRKLDPKEIEKQAGGGGFLGKRAWETFVALHRDLETESQRLFREVIFPGLRKGYFEAHAEPGRGQDPDADA